LDNLGDAISFLSTCSDEFFLDFIEIVFQIESTTRLPDSRSLISDFNEFFGVDRLPFALTDYVWEAGKETIFGVQREFMRLTRCPQIVRKDSQIVYNQVIEPTLTLLSEKHFYTANREFLESLDDYRKGDFGDCLVKCGSAFESTLKIICDQRGWVYSPTDTVAPLLKTVLNHSGLDSFFEQPIVLIATMRNRLSKAHGAGVSQRDVTRAQAEFAINITGAAILLVVKECAA
jgi:predicted nucleic-acid-binding protein